ncbi:hypothetical protein ADK57_32265 [Streptomyces sp. MMG1533]|uniref:acyl-CoA dehydrogenase family protein n=1 Tax=Streptomyces sp. MMG1533 TaxID=1415546 RepID=UPI0006B037D2|nr:acyl-CoA dehydrogenase family protein [Streptomyces sp. MMG1533]KOU59804.1 hypothetical protein ADK57_32265 [Streptomyces sp. MMG1533]
MVNLELDAEQLEVAELGRQLGLEVLSPVAREAEERRGVPEGVWRTLFETGLTVPVPEELGGAGIGDTVTLMVALENLSYGDPGIVFAAYSSGVAAMLLARHGGPERAALVRGLTSDPTARGAVALYEGQGRGAAEFATVIHTTDDGRIRVRGHKTAVAFGADADPLVVVGTDERSGAVRAVLVPRDTDGITVKAYDGGLALDAARTAAMSFDVTVPAENLLDAEDLLTTLGRIRLGVAAIALGTAWRAIDYAAEYATERVAFGRPIAAFQGVSFPLAEAQMRITQARLETLDLAARLHDPDAADLTAAISRLLAHVGETAAEATRAAVQTLGGHGFIAEHPVELWYRSAMALSALDFDPLCSSFTPAL